MNLFDLFATLSLDSSKFEQGIRKASQTANTFTGTLVSGFSKAFTSTGNSLTNIGRGIVAVGDGITAVGQQASVVSASLGALLTATFTKAKTFIGTYESAMVVFRRKLQGGEEEAKNMYNELVRIAKGSAYAQEYMISAGKTLVAMGLDFNKTSKYVQAATDAIAAFGGTGADVEDLAHRFARMSQQTTLYTMDLNMLVDKGVPAWDILATKYKTTTAAVKEMAKKGMLPAKQSLEVLTNAMEETNEQSEMFKYSVAGMAQALKSGTLTGVLDSLNTSFRSLSLSLLDLDPREKTGAENIRKLNSALTAFGKTMEKIGSKFSKLGKDLGSLFSKVADALGRFNERLDSLSEEKANAIVKWVEAIALSGPGLIVAGKGVKVFGNSVKGLGAIYTGLGKALDFSKITKGFGTVKNTFNKLAPGLKNVGNAFSNLFKTAMSMAPTMTKLFNKLGGVIASFGRIVFKVFTTVLSTFKWLFVNAMEMLGYMLEPFKILASKIAGVFKPIINIIGGVFSKIGGVLSAALSKFLGFAGYIGKLVGYMLEPFKILASKIGSLLKPVISAIGAFFGKIGGFLSKAFQLISNFVVQARFLFANLFKKISGFLKPLFGAFQQVFSAVSGLLGKLAPIAAKALMGLGGIIFKAFNIGGVIALVVAGLGLLQQKFGDKIAQISDFLLTKAPEAIQNFANGIISKLPEIEAAGIQLLTTIFTAITSNLPVILNAGIQMLVTLVQGLASALPTLVPQIVQCVIAIAQVLIDNAGLIFEAGVQLIFGLLQGIWAAIEPFKEKILGWGLVIFAAIIALGPIISAAIAAVTTLVSAAISAAMALITSAITMWPVTLGIAIAGLIIAFWPQISEFFSNLGGMISEGLANLIVLVSNWFDEFWAGLGAWIGEMWNNLISFLTEHWQDILLWVTNLPLAIIKTLYDSNPEFAAWLNGLWDSIVQWWNNLWTSVLNWGAEMIAKGIEIASNFITGVINFIKDLPSQIGAFLSGVISKVISWGADMIAKGRQAAIDFFDSIVNKIKEIPDEMLKIGKNIVEGIWNGINNAIDWIKGKINDFKDGILGGFSWAFKMNSPSKLMRDEIGKNLALGIGIGFEQEIDGVKKDMINSMNDLTDIGAVDNISYSASYNGKANAGLVNGLLSAIGMDDNETTINLVVDGRTLAEVMYNPMTRLVQQKGAALNA